MSKIVVYALTSLDGAVESPDRYFPETPNNTGPPVFDEDLEACEVAMLERQAAVLLGRRMFDEWSTFWPTSNDQPFADFINEIPKYVLTSRPLPDSPWKNVRAVHGPLAQVVSSLKDRVPGDVGVHGSVTLARSLLQAGLVDEIYLAMGRVLDPQGPRLFPQGGSRRTILELVDARPTRTGSVWLHYRVDRS